MRIPVALEGRGYDVVLAAGARAELGALLASCVPNAHTAAIVVDESLVDREWFDLDTGLATTVITVPSGEAAKTLAQLERLCDAFVDARVSRHDVIVAVGGGATTDLAGFAAGTYLRGVAVAHVPTTVLGQVDAAIGGKTAVDLAAGKNLVGVFHQPIGVLCDLETLMTLAPREYRSGLGEVAKCWLLARRDAASLAVATREAQMANAIELKARVVAADEREGGPRATLNYGHTLGHALEHHTRDSSSALLHGEAVAIGLAYAARLARALDRVSDDEVRETDAVLDTFALPRRLPPGCELEPLVTLMGVDKKAHHDLAFVLAGPRGVETVRNVSVDAVTMVLEQFAEESA